MPKKKIPVKLKLIIAARAHHRCEYCQAFQAYSSSPFNGDHIEAEVLGGKTDLENLAHTCNGCNGRKAKKSHAVDPLTGEVFRLFHPRKNKWTDHFKWSKEDLMMEGITPVGRATVQSLQLNRPELINLRRVWKLIGIHPPKG